MNQKYLVKFEKGNFEQVFKISEFDYLVKDVEDIKKVAGEAFIEEILKRFEGMQMQLARAMEDY